MAGDGHVDRPTAGAGVSERGPEQLHATLVIALVLGEMGAHPRRDASAEWGALVEDAEPAADAPAAGELAATHEREDLGADGHLHEEGGVVVVEEAEALRLGERLHQPLEAHAGIAEGDLREAGEDGDPRSLDGRNAARERVPSGAESCAGPQPKGAT